MRWAGAVLFMVVLLAGCAEPPPYDRRAHSVAAYLIWEHPYPKLLVEIDYAPGREPLPSSLELMERTLNDLTDKREVRFLKPTALPDEPRFQEVNRNWSLHELDDVREEFFTNGKLNQLSRDDTVFLYVLFLNGHSYHRYEVGGLQTSNIIYILPDSMNEVQKVSGPLPVRKPHYEQVENWVLIHETGHALGLVGGDVPMVHPRMSGKDDHHSTYRSSPMYGFTFYDLSVLDALSGEDFVPTEFDQYDLEDLARFRAIGRERSS